uniref:UCH37-like C-terminal domain-containing protein n=1 Tax=Meloidogyne enterolobii TaxID=390850 RepID=A0A6V7WVD0_MELEN|nr:unnamed protein product [Meloidogyne enterolobii]
MSLLNNELPILFNKSTHKNNRRRHNYMPFLIELLKCLAKEGKLVDLVCEAQEKKKKSATSPTKKVVK